MKNDEPHQDETCVLLCLLCLPTLIFCSKKLETTAENLRVKLSCSFHSWQSVTLILNTHSFQSLAVCGLFYPRVALWFRKTRWRWAFTSRGGGWGKGVFQTVTVRVWSVLFLYTLWALMGTSWFCMFGDVKACFEQSQFWILACIFDHSVSVLNVNSGHLTQRASRKPDHRTRNHVVPHVRHKPETKTRTLESSAKRQTHCSLSVSNESGILCQGEAQRLTSPNKVFWCRKTQIVLSFSSASGAPSASFYGAVQAHKIPFWNTGNFHQQKPILWWLQAFVDDRHFWPQWEDSHVFWRGVQRCAAWHAKKRRRKHPRICQWLNKKRTDSLGMKFILRPESEGTASGFLRSDTVFGHVVCRNERWRHLLLSGVNSSVILRTRLGRLDPHSRRNVKPEKDAVHSFSKMPRSCWCSISLQIKLQSSSASVLESFRTKMSGFSFCRKTKKIMWNWQVNCHHEIWLLRMLFDENFPLETKQPESIFPKVFLFRR